MSSHPTKYNNPLINYILYHNTKFKTTVQNRAFSFISTKALMHCTHNCTPHILRRERLLQVLRIGKHVNDSITTFVRFSDLIKTLIGSGFIITINSLPKSRLFVGFHFWIRFAVGILLLQRTDKVHDFMRVFR